MRERECVAVVLGAGTGSRLTELTRSVPKCLLPLLGLPLFTYPLRTLEKTGIRQVYLVVPSNAEGEVRHVLASQTFNLKVEVVTPPVGSDAWGTAEMLRHLGLHGDVLCLSVDFVSDVSLRPFLDKLRVEDADVGCLFGTRSSIDMGTPPGSKTKKMKNRDLVGIFEASDRLLFCHNEEDVEDSVLLETKLLSKFKNVKLTAKYMDCHVYFFKEWTINLLQSQKDMVSLKTDFLPFLINAQFNNTEGVKRPEKERLLLKAQRASEGGEEVISPIIVTAWRLPLESSSFVGHLNTLSAYFEANKALLKCAACFPFTPPSHSSSLEATVSESWLGEDVVLEEKALVKKSVIGTGSSIGKNAKVQASLIMKNVRIGEGATISNSILANGAVVGDGADVSNSIVTASKSVAVKSKIQNEVVESDDEMDMD